jgi:DNA-binding transcriptional LysR family regulator
METRLLEMFGSLADTLHFGRAAERLGLTQPALSRGIRRLEQDLEVQLFVRDSRNVRLTPAGVAFRAVAADLVERARQAARAARVAGGLSSETLVLGVGVGASQPPVGRLIRRFRERHPELRVALRSVEEHEVAQALAEGTVHGVITVDWALPSGCSSRFLYETELRMAVPSGSLLASQAAVGPQDLDGLEVLVPCRREQPMIFDRFRLYCEEAGVEPVLAVDAKTLDQVLAVVSGGAAAAILPAPSELRYPGVVWKEIRPRYPLSFIVGWRHASDMLDRLVPVLDGV